MENLFKMFGYTVYYFLVAMGYALLFRAVLSLFMDDRESNLLAFLELITEPPIAIVRGTVGRLFESMASPIDISFIITVFLNEMLTVIVGQII